MKSIFGENPSFSTANKAFIKKNAFSTLCPFYPQKVKPKEKVEVEKGEKETGKEV